VRVIPNAISATPKEEC